MPSTQCWEAAERVRGGAERGDDGRGQHRDHELHSELGLPPVSLLLHHNPHHYWYIRSRDELFYQKYLFNYNLPTFQYTWWYLYFFSPILTSQKLNYLVRKCGLSLPPA